jgi:hypothetical protein
MQAPKLLILIAVFLFTSIVSVVTGSTSLSSLSVMIQLEIEPHVAVATNMLGMTRNESPVSPVQTIIGFALTLALSVCRGFLVDTSQY